MPKLKRLSGKEVIKILRLLGFEEHYQRGSHVHMRRIVDDQEQDVTVPLHGNKDLKLGTLAGIYKQTREYVSEEDLREHFYSE